MRTVGINCEILVDDDTAMWIENLIKSNNLPSELAYYLTQRKNGGYVVKSEELDAIVDSIVSDTDNSVQQDTIEEAVKKAMLELVASGSLNLGTVSEAATTAKSEGFNSTSEDTDDKQSELVVFASDPTDGEAEEMSAEDADDLADFFGF